LASYKGGFVRAINQYIGLALHETGANLDVEIASGTVVKEDIVSPAINVKEEGAADWRTAAWIASCISAGNRYVISEVAGARARSTADDAGGGV
jgi:hypothetical protein